MSVKFTDNAPRVVANERRVANIFLRLMAQEIFRVSDPKTPKRFGNLRRNRLVQVLGLSAIIQWNVKYAAFQEDRQYRNYTTPGTGPHFAEQGVHGAMKQAGRIYKQARQAL